MEALMARAYIWSGYLLQALTFDSRHGMLEIRLRQAIKKVYDPQLHRDLDVEKEILVTSGANEGQYSVFTAFLEQGDEVIMFEPFFDQYLASVTFNGGVPIYVPLHSPANASGKFSSDEWKIDPKELRAAITPRTKMIIVNTPHNPVGKVFTRAELEMIASLAKEHNLLVMADEVYDTLVFDGKEHVQIATLPGMWDCTVTVGSAGSTSPNDALLFPYFLANTYPQKASPRLAGAWLIGPEYIIRPTLAASTCIVFCSKSPLQEAAAAGLEQVQECKFFQTQTAEYAERRKVLTDCFDTLGLSYTNPEGSYFILLDISRVEFPDDYAFPQSVLGRGRDFNVDKIQSALGPNKKLDLFEPARIDCKTPLETIMNNLVTLVKEGKFLHIGLSECNANTLRKANEIYPITAAEIEVSPWSYDHNQKAVISTARELNITVVAYSPLGRGYLTEGDIRSRLTRFKEENFKANWAIVEGLQVIAKKKGVTPAQLSIAWVALLGPHMLLRPGSSKASRTLENLKAGALELTAEESKAIDEVITTNPVFGDRYFGSDEQDSVVLSGFEYNNAWNFFDGPIGSLDSESEQELDLSSESEAEATISNQTTISFSSLSQSSNVPSPNLPSPAHSNADSVAPLGVQVDPLQHVSDPMAVCSDEDEDEEDIEHDYALDQEYGVKWTGEEPEFSDSEGKDDEDGEGLEKELNELFEQELAEFGEEITDEELALLRHFALKVETHMSNDTFAALAATFPNDPPASWKVTKKRAEWLARLRPVIYECCINSCVCYMGPHADKKQCPHCKEFRYRPDGKTPRKRFTYVPIIPRLTAYYRSLSMIEKLRYHTTFQPTNGEVHDVFDCRHYQQLKCRNVKVKGQEIPYQYFADSHDIALGLSSDGFAPWRRRTKTCWPLILYNYNLPPEIRFHLEYILCVGVIPGPKKPKDFDSFLWPLVEELLELASGVPTFDSKSKTTFILWSFLILVFGDIPAISMVMKMKGHNGVCPCRMCNIKGVATIHGKKTYYVPLDRSRHPTVLNNPTLVKKYDPLNLPLRSHDEMCTQAKEVVFEAPTRSKELAKQYGINGLPILQVLDSLSFPIAFPYDFMHLLFENVIKNLVLLWTGKYKELDEGSGEYEFPKGVWEAIGVATAASDPTCILLPPRRPASTVTQFWTDKICVALATRYNTSIQTIRKYLSTDNIERWGKVRRLNGGDSMNASSLVPIAEDRRDATFIRYELLVDRNARSRKKRSEFTLQAFYGQLQHIFVVTLKSTLVLGIDIDTTLILARIQRAEMKNFYSTGLFSSTKMGLSEVMDMTSVQCLIGRIKAGTHGWVVLDRTGVQQWAMHVTDT
ncbi:hypothetical protein HHX47_DHR4000610 [Lentinula edodes]|nr:hypothetical protein HHX47_DHR4000610 [Lentinula edodes]